MHRDNLLQLLAKYQPADDTEQQIKSDINSFIQANANCFNNHLEAGHITASAWIYDPKTKMVGLVHHAKLDKWVQTGGHSDDNPDTASESLREAQEEFGEKGLFMRENKIFCLDIHHLPYDAKRSVPPHLHYDITFLVVGDSSIQPVLSEESYDAKWIALDDVLTYNSDSGITRMVNKTKTLEL